ncbi:MAG: sulfotransferase domain-containing protein [Chitinophagales bacterium]|nr:sulfotransferase domain-containing protein [Chitinophagales bacterium]MDW8393568.1 sulfotransferase domain-containing protein [Chitinophagales bacterium]
MGQQLPNLIIAGVHKAGTTSVFTYLSLHPQVCGSSIKEIGYFMPLRYGLPLPDASVYAAYWNHCKPQAKYRLEASPSYLYGGSVIAAALEELLGREVRILILLRNPAERLFSFYERKKVNAYLPQDMTFRRFAELSLQRCGQEPKGLREEDTESLLRRGISEGFYADYLPPWLERYGNRLRLLFFEDLRNDTPAFMQELCQWLELDFSVYRPEDFVIENQTTAVRSGWLHRSLLAVNKKFESFWRKNVALKRTLRRWYKQVNTVEGKRERLREEDRQWLEEIYRPYNARLVALLQQHGISRWPEWLTRSAYEPTAS